MASKKDPESVAEEFAAQMRKTFGQELQAVLLVGSAARGDFIPGKSDINTLVILTLEGMNWLEKAYQILQTFRRKGLAVPHFMTPDAVQQALDSYPLEFLDFKSFHKVILGPDILADVSVPPQALRLQIERELRGKLFLLRQVFASEAGHSKQLEAVMKRSIAVFTAVFQGMLELGKRPIPADRPTLFREGTALAGVSDRVFQQILQVRGGKGAKNQFVIFKELLKEVGDLVLWIDSYQVT